MCWFGCVGLDVWVWVYWSGCISLGVLFMGVLIVSVLIVSVLSVGVLSVSVLGISVLGVMYLYTIRCFLCEYLFLIAMLEDAIHPLCANL